MFKYEVKLMQGSTQCSALPPTVSRFPHNISPEVVTAPGHAIPTGCFLFTSHPDVAKTSPNLSPINQIVELKKIRTIFWLGSGDFSYHLSSQWSMLSPEFL